MSVVPEARAIGRHVACARRREGSDEARERRLTEEERRRVAMAEVTQGRGAPKPLGMALLQALLGIGAAAASIYAPADTDTPWHRHHPTVFLCFLFAIWMNCLELYNFNKLQVIHFQMI